MKWNETTVNENPAFFAKTIFGYIWVWCDDHNRWIIRYPHNEWPIGTVFNDRAGAMIAAEIEFKSRLKDSWAAW